MTSLGDLELQRKSQLTNALIRGANFYAVDKSFGRVILAGKDAEARKERRDNFITRAGLDASASTESALRAAFDRLARLRKADIPEDIKLDVAEKIKQAIRVLKKEHSPRSMQQLLDTPRLLIRANRVLSTPTRDLIKD